MPKNISSNKKLKIAFFHCAFVYSGGGERIALEGVLGLREKGHIVDLYSPATDFDKCFPDLLKRVPPKPIIPQLPKGFPLKDGLNMLLASIFALFAAYKFKDYDIYIGENQPGTWLAFVYARLFKKPYIVYLNQPNRMIYPRAIDIKTGWFANKNFVFLQYIVRLGRPLVAYFDKISTVNANFLTCNGSYIGDIISQIYGKRYLDCPAGCDPFPHGKLEFNIKKYFAGSIRVNGFTIQKPYIFLTNRHYPQKKFEYAIEAMAKVKQKFPKSKLVISGAFTQTTRRWKEKAKKIGVDKNIVWAGELKNEDMGLLYENAAVYVYTSPEEDYGMGVVEAEEFGVPVVAWNHAGPTVTVDNGRTGLLAKPYDVSDFADKIIWLLGNPQARVKMGKAANQHVQSNFTWKRHISILEKALYDSLQGKSL